MRNQAADMTLLLGDAADRVDDFEPELVDEAIVFLEQNRETLGSSAIDEERDECLAIEHAD